MLSDDNTTNLFKIVKTEKRTTLSISKLPEVRQTVHEYDYRNVWDGINDELCKLGIPFFFWQASSPACTELEMNVLDWLAKAMGLPPHFLHHHPDSRGGGILQVENLFFLTPEHLWLQ